MNRRRFLGLLGASTAGLALDPERLLWVPGQKSYHVVQQSPRLWWSGWSQLSTQQAWIGHWTKMDWERTPQGLWGRTTRVITLRRVFRGETGRSDDPVVVADYQVRRDPGVLDLYQESARQELVAHPRAPWYQPEVI